MYTLIFADSGNIISRHRTVLNAYKANKKFQRAVERANGQGSYMLTAIIDGNDQIVHPFDCPEAAAIERFEFGM